MPYNVTLHYTMKAPTPTYHLTTQNQHTHTEPPTNLETSVAHKCIKMECGGGFL